MRSRRQSAALVPIGFFVPVAAALMWSVSGTTTAEPGVLGYLVGILTWNIVPYLILAGVLWAGRKQWAWRTALVYSVLAGVLGIVVAAAMILGQGSTAALAALTLPLWLLAGMIPAAVIGWAFHRNRGRRAHGGEALKVG